MSDITPGKRCVAPFDVIGDAIYAPAQTESRRNEVVAFGITNKSDARLIAAAPEMYELVMQFAFGSCDDCMRILDESRKVLDRIDGKEKKSE